MDEELKTYLDAKFAEVGTKLAGVDGRFAEVDVKLAELRAHVSEECEKVETKLLGEFWKWGRTSDMRTRQALAESAALGNACSRSRTASPRSKGRRLRSGRRPPRPKAVMRYMAACDIAAGPVNPRLPVVFSRVRAPRFDRHLHAAVVRST